MAAERVERYQVYNNEKLKEEFQKWAGDQRRPLILVAIGRGGAGKSTLVNNLLELEEGDDDYCPEGDLACAETKEVKLRKKENLRQGVTVHIADTPGLGASVDKIDPEKVIKELSEKTKKEADIVFYCISLHPSAKPCDTDVKIVKLLTKAYGHEIWKRTFLVLTFANQCRQRDYTAKIDSYVTQFAEVLKKANVNIPVKAVLPIEEQIPPPAQAPPTPSAAADYIPAIPVGDKPEGEEPILLFPCRHNWSESLFIEILKKASHPQTLANLLALRGFTIKIEEVVGGAVGGASVGGTVGGALGAGFGLGLGVIIGAPVGAAAGGIGGVVLAISKAKLEKFRVTHF